MFEALIYGKIDRFIPVDQTKTAKALIEILKNQFLMKDDHSVVVFKDKKLIATFAKDKKRYFFGHQIDLGDNPYKLKKMKKYLFYTVKQI